MPVKSDAKRRWVELEVLLPGTPEQVWQAIATGPGLSAWFTATTVEERVGGAIRFEFGEGMASAGTVTVWEPPFRFAYEERGWSSEAPPLATECVITSRSGDTCVLRLVHSLFTSEGSWDDEMEGFESGWPGFFEVLRAYLARFAGMRGAAARAMGMHPGSDLDAWTDLVGRLGLAGANVGERRNTPDGAPALAGTVERVQQDAKSREIMLLLEQPAPGIALIGIHNWQGRTRVPISAFFYGDRAGDVAARVEAELRAWMTKHFPEKEGE
ncbi:SRPBCC domain-containing protein [Inquilinus limosus]|uniref:SRPBCC family protein n=1 Tax=Inquilinus limosus TaxID=171674 RepID=UPI003F13C1AA